MSSNLGLLVGVFSLCLYGFAMFRLSNYILHAVQVKGQPSDPFIEHMQTYGLFKFLTIQCLIIQIISAFLHVVAHFVKPLRGVRDMVFTVLAFPVGSIVVYTFWFVWLVLGRELIFPARFDAFYPPWLNHTTHTIIAPVNILLAVLVNHKYMKRGVLVTLVYMSAYTIFLHAFKAQTGHFVYPYLDHLSSTLRTVYFVLTAVFTYLMYRFSQLITKSVHGSDDIAKKPVPKGQKQR